MVSFIRSSKSWTCKDVHLNTRPCYNRLLKVNFRFLTKYKSHPLLIDLSGNHFPLDSCGIYWYSIWNLIRLFQSEMIWFVVNGSWLSLDKISTKSDFDLPNTVYDQFLRRKMRFEPDVCPTKTELKTDRWKSEADWSLSRTLIITELVQTRPADLHQRATCSRINCTE